MTAGDWKGARRPLSYGEPSDREPCEGRQASPSNPTEGTRRSPKGDLNAVVVFRCTASEKQALTARAARTGLPFATLMREALGLTEVRRRRPVPKVDPELVRAVARIGGNLNQIARWLNTAQSQGHVSPIDAIEVAAQLVAIERALSETLRSFTAKDGAPC
ncbi:MobC family plasmid mobilization relaxosome protein [Agrobacterium sp. Ap1]|uniref:MobC family plasmid mobilization relaxosome protein n=1 Tax=Agrobacterium sp. Ap1 TaxID=2815337 RepID=UPI001A8D5673|nr:MobC family plasmid mobilization relaxosome protein [Agrobacterium sp. Ap1]MBO0145420.1 MobC family plasmid mobilization relaxosome protein [Agrobacterium sp. Ap1]